VQLGDIRLNLFDTAGLRETEDAIEIPLLHVYP